MELNSKKMDDVDLPFYPTSCPGMTFVLALTIPVGDPHTFFASGHPSQFCMTYRNTVKTSAE